MSALRKCPVIRERLDTWTVAKPLFGGSRIWDSFHVGWNVEAIVCESAGCERGVQLDNQVRAWGRPEWPEQASQRSGPTPAEKAIHRSVQSSRPRCPGDSSHGQQERMPAFWAGGSTWRVRYAPPVPGTYHFRTACSDTQNKDLHARVSELNVLPRPVRTATTSMAR